MKYYFFYFGCAGSSFQHTGFLIVEQGLSCLQGMWDLSFPTRDQTQVLCIGRQIPHHWTTRKVPSFLFFSLHLFSFPLISLLAYSCLDILTPINFSSKRVFFFKWLQCVMMNHLLISFPCGFVSLWRKDGDIFSPTCPAHSGSSKIFTDGGDLF